MKITRNGETFELTNAEMYNAYLEMQHKYDMQDIDGWFSHPDDPLTDEQISEIAYLYRGNMENSDNDYISEWFFQMGDDAYRTVIGEED